MRYRQFHISYSPLQLTRRNVSGSNASTRSCSTFRPNPFSVFIRSTRKGFRRCGLLVDREFRHEAFKNIGSDIRLNCVAGCVIFFFGDILAQFGENRVKKELKERGQQKSERVPGVFLDMVERYVQNKLNSDINIRRSIAMSVQGIILNGIMLTPFYRWLDILFGDTHKTRKIFPSVLQKVLAVQLLYMPISTAIYIGLTPLLHYLLKTGVVIHSRSKHSNDPNFQTSVTSLQAGYFQLRRSFLDVYLTSWIFWPLSDAFNFRFLPVRYRPVWDSFVDIFWTALLSFVTHGGSYKSHQLF